MERRAINRVSIPGTQIQYRKKNGHYLFKVLSKPVQVSNLSKSGIGFKTGQHFKFGDVVDMRIVFPDGTSLHLKGHIRWNSVDESTDKNNVGIQFFPFGKRSNYNPISALEYLREIPEQDIDDTIAGDSQ